MKIYIAILILALSITSCNELNSFDEEKEKKEILKFNKYFSSVEFIKWDDVTGPIIRFSKDGTLAYTIVDKIVQVTYQGKKGEMVRGETHFAWTAIYKK